MNTTIAAQHAGVTVATIRTWCRIGAVGARKAAGRWIITAASLARRIQIGRKPMKIEPLTRAEYEQAVHGLGLRATVKDARCHGEYRAVTTHGENSYGTPAAKLSGHDLLMVRRGAALAAGGYIQPAPARGPGYAAGLPGQIFGGPSADRADECHYCGQALDRSGECEECR